MSVILGLTGGTGCGKSTVAAYLVQKGAAVIDADAIARTVVLPGKPALIKLSAAFDDILLPNGSLNRKKLGAQVFSDPEKLNTLNHITHTYIIEEINRQLAALKNSLIVIDAPLLLECGLDVLCTACAAVLAEKAVRCARITERDGLNREQAEARINAQPEDSFYTERCRFILYNNGSTPALYRAVDAMLKELIN